MEAAMGLMRRIPPKRTETTLSALLSLTPHQSFDLLFQVDQPLQVLCIVECGKEFTLCEYNRDADSYSYMTLEYDGWIHLDLLRSFKSRLLLTQKAP